LKNFINITKGLQENRNFLGGEGIWAMI
jgi:hypothetical protein